MEGIDDATFVQQLQAKVLATEQNYNAKITSEQQELAQNRRRLDRNKKQLASLREGRRDIKERLRNGEANVTKYEEEKKQRLARLQDALEVFQPSSITQSIPIVQQQQECQESVVIMTQEIVVDGDKEVVLNTSGMEDAGNTPTSERSIDTVIGPRADPVTKQANNVVGEDAVGSITDTGGPEDAGNTAIRIQSNTPDIANVKPNINEISHARPEFQIKTFLTTRYLVARPTVVSFNQGKSWKILRCPNCEKYDKVPKNAQCRRELRKSLTGVGGMMHHLQMTHAKQGKKQHEGDTKRWIEFIRKDCVVRGLTLTLQEVRSMGKGELQLQHHVGFTYEDIVSWLSPL